MQAQGLWMDPSDTIVPHTCLKGMRRGQSGKHLHGFQGMLKRERQQAAFRTNILHIEVLFVVGPNRVPRILLPWRPEEEEECLEHLAEWPWKRTGGRRNHPLALQALANF